MNAEPFVCQVECDDSVEQQELAGLDEIASVESVEVDTTRETRAVKLHVVIPRLLALVHQGRHQLTERIESIPPRFCQFPRPPAPPLKTDTLFVIHPVSRSRNPATNFFSRVGYSVGEPVTAARKR
jgi:hypothetical protein